MNNPFLDADVNEKNATIFYTWGIYLKLLLFPHPLTYDYYPKHIPIIDFSDFRAILSFLLYAMMGIIALLGLKKSHMKKEESAVIFYSCSILIEVCS